MVLLGLVELGVHLSVIVSVFLGRAPSGAGLIHWGGEADGWSESECLCVSQEDPLVLNEIGEDLRTECEKFGQVKKVLIFDVSMEADWVWFSIVGSIILQGW